MKIGCLNSDTTKTSTRLAGKYIPGGCCRRRRKLSIPTNNRGWFGVVRKKFLVKTKLSTPHTKNIIIIHNNTSIASNEEDNRKSSCVEPGKDQIISATAKIKDQKPPPGDGVVEDKPSTVTTTIDGGDQENGVKDDSGMMTTKNHSKLDDEVIVDEKLSTLPNVDAEAEAVAAIRIQTAFRGHLARRAFGALKGLVKLQAVVRGVVVRRQARMALHCMRALVRLGDRVRARQLLSRSTEE